MNENENIKKKLQDKPEESSDRLGQNTRSYNNYLDNISSNLLYLFRNLQPANSLAPHACQSCFQFQFTDLDLRETNKATKCTDGHAWIACSDVQSEKFIHLIIILAVNF